MTCDVKEVEFTAGGYRVLRACRAVLSFARAMCWSVCAGDARRDYCRDLCMVCRSIVVLF